MPQQNGTQTGMRSAFFWLAAGLGLAGAVALAWPASAPWMLFAAALCLALALFLGSSRSNAGDQVTAAKADPAAGQWNCFCEVDQLTGSALRDCQTNQTTESKTNGWGLPPFTHA